MDDLNAFDRQLADEVRFQAGPSRPADVARVIESVMSRPSRARFGAMFSAARFLVAGVIVTLFGGLLLSSALVTRQSEESLPVGASAKPEASALKGLRLPAELPDDVRGGALESSFGPARWVQVQLGWRSHPEGPRPLPAPDGFVLLDDEQPVLWRSPDLIDWTAERLAVGAANAELLLADGTYWLSRSWPAGLWRSEDTIAWQQIDLSELVSPFPEWLVAGPSIDRPISRAGVSIVPFAFSPEVTGSDLGLPDLDNKDWQLFESAEPGVYEATLMKATIKRGVHARVRFEVTDTGLRVIDASDETTLAELDGVGPELVDAMVRGGLPGVSRLARVEGDALVPVDRPWPPGQELTLGPDQEDRLFGTESGFVAYRYAPDSDLAHAWRSTDGVTWIEAEPLGDDPGEPTRLHDMRTDGPSGDLEAVSWEAAWLTSDGVTWRESERPPAESASLRRGSEFNGSVRMGSGWMRLSEDGLSYRADSEDAWASMDLTELGVEIDVDPDGEYGVAGYGGFHAISPDTIVVPSQPESWIITFDDLPERR